MVELWLSLNVLSFKLAWRPRQPQHPNERPAVDSMPVLQVFLLLELSLSIRMDDSSGHLLQIEVSPKEGMLFTIRVFSRPGIHSSLAWSSGEHNVGICPCYDAPVVKAHQFPQHFEFNAVGQERKRCKL